MPVGSVTTSPWAAPRRRAEALSEKYAFADEVLGLYLALLDVWEESWTAARAELAPATPDSEVAAWAAERVLPRVVAATIDAGPAPLAAQLAAMPTDDVLAAEQLLAAWLEGAELVPAEQYLARATLRGALAATAADPAEPADATPASGNVLRCPRCAGPPQLSFREDTGEKLVTPARRLQCARCLYSWPFSSTACAACGESGAGKLTIHAEQRPGLEVARGDRGNATFPHLRIESCDSCKHYLIDVDQCRDPRAVPEVDELAAIPLDLYAAELGLTKITPNVMGF